METRPVPRSADRPRYAAIACLALACLAPAVTASESPLPAGVEVRRDVPYAANANPRQTLDLYLPKERTAGTKLPVIVFIHGGGWVGGNKSSGRAALQDFVAGGNYAAASVAYRLAGEARWPAQIQDCKAAIRWIRANAASLGIDGERIAVMGTSAGGTLATLLGVSADVAALEGEVGSHAGTSSRVTCVVNRFGRLDFDAEPESARADGSARLDHAVCRIEGHDARCLHVRRPRGAQRNAAATGHRDVTGGQRSADLRGACIGADATTRCARSGDGDRRDAGRDQAGIRRKLDTDHEIERAHA